MQKQFSTRHVSQQSDEILQSEAKAYEATALTNIAVHAGDAERVASETDRRGRPS